MCHLRLQNKACLPYLHHNIHSAGSRRSLRTSTDYPRCSHCADPEPKRKDRMRLHYAAATKEEGAAKNLDGKTKAETDCFARSLKKMLQMNPKGKA